MRAAIGLMERFGVAASLIGDLAEASAHHRHIWLWRQATAAIAVALAKDMVAHPLLALRSVIVGLVLLAACQPPLEWLWSQLNLPFSLAVVYLGLRHQIALTASIVRGMLFIPASFGVGWLVARLHRTRTPAMVLTFLVVTWFLNIPNFWRVLLNAMDQARFRPYLAVNLFGLMVFNVSVIAGAFWGQRMPVMKTPAGDWPSHAEKLTE